MSGVGGLGRAGEVLTQCLLNGGPAFLGLEIRDDGLDKFVRTGIRLCRSQRGATREGLFENAPQTAWSAADTAMPANMVLSRILVHSSGLKFRLFAMTTSYSLLTYKLYQTSMVWRPQMSAMGH